jgi:hypothetical protein
MDSSDVELWFDRERQKQMVAKLVDRIGLTRVRADCFLRLWIYLSIKEQRERQPHLKPPLVALKLLKEAVPCSLREAAELFYHDKERGGERSAGMMLDKLAALGLIRKEFDGNITRIEIVVLPELAEATPVELVEMIISAFDPRSDAILVANLLAAKYNWMNRSTEAMPHRIASILRQWASKYDRGMRVLRRKDNLRPVGFYLFYPTAAVSASNFFTAPSKSLHLSVMGSDDPFVIAAVGDLDCTSIFARSWVIDDEYVERYRVPFLIDCQQVLRAMQQDFPNLCDIYMILIHPSYEQQARALGFQSMSRDRQASLQWLYLPLDRFLQIDIQESLFNE